MVSSAWVEHADRLNRSLAFEAAGTSNYEEVVPIGSEAVAEYVLRELDYWAGSLELGKDHH